MNVKVSVAVRLPPSVTVSVIVTGPLLFAGGVMATVRPPPPVVATMIAASGRIVWFEDVAVTVSEAAAVSASPTVKATAARLPSSAIVCVGTSLIVGAVFAETLTMKT